RIRTGAREAFDQMQILVRSPEMSLISEIGRVDDQRISLPMAARIPHPLSNARRQMRTPVEGDDANVVNHLDQNRDVFGRLHDLIIIVVPAGYHRWSGGRPQDTAVGQA